MISCPTIGQVSNLENGHFVTLVLVSDMMKWYIILYTMDLFNFVGLNIHWSPEKIIVHRHSKWVIVYKIVL